MIVNFLKDHLRRCARISQRGCLKVVWFATFGSLKLTLVLSATKDFLGIIAQCKQRVTYWEEEKNDKQ